jgi:hypothetical protein
VLPRIALTRHLTLLVPHTAGHLTGESSPGSRHTRRTTDWGVVQGSRLGPPESTRCRTGLGVLYCPEEFSSQYPLTPGKCR